MTVKEKIGVGLAMCWAVVSVLLGIDLAHGHLKRQKFITAGIYLAGFVVIFRFFFS